MSYGYVPEKKRMYKSWEFCCNPFEIHSNRKQEYMKTINYMHYRRLKKLGFHWIKGDMMLCMDCRRILRTGIKSLDELESKIKWVKQHYTESEGESTDCDKRYDKAENSDDNDSDW